MNPDDITAAAGEGAAHTFTLALRAPPWHLGAEPSEAELLAAPKRRKPSPTACSVPDCDRPSVAHTLCNAHYKKKCRYGDPLAGYSKAPNGNGTITPDGYLKHAGKQEHVSVAEKALGKPLPAGALVHHVDENRLNNTPTNLVICPGNGYHALLHQRMRAFAACGHYDWRKCEYCQKWDAVENLRAYSARASFHHAACNAAYQRAARQARKA